MKILEKEDPTLLLVEHANDLWWIKHIIKEGDQLKAWTLRTIKKGTKEEKRWVLITIEVEKITFTEHPISLRCTGKIVESNSEDVQKGKYHSIDIQEGTKFWIWGKNIALIKKIKERANKFAPTYHILLIDDEMAKLYCVNGIVIKQLFEIRKEKKSEKEEEKTIFYQDIFKGIQGIKKLIVAGPGFEKEGLMHYLKEKGVKVMTAKCYDIEEGAIHYLIKSGIVSKLGKEMESEEIENEWNIFLMHLGKEDGLACYGWDEIKKISHTGAIETIFILISMLKENKEIQNALSEMPPANILIIHEKEHISEQIKSLGGVCAILRYKINV